MTPLVPADIATPRLILTCVSEETAASALAGDLSSLPRTGGWPHDDTLDALRMAVRSDNPALVWLVTLDGIVIGDCGTAGGIDAAGQVEIGYGLAAEHRGSGYGSELVAALSEWLIEQPGVLRVMAGVLATNIASRRVLERAGFVCESETGPETRYALTRA